MIGLPHSGHSPGVSGSVSSSMVLSTSTKGTSATTAPHSSGSEFTTAPISSPPAEPPLISIRPALANFSAIKPFATSTKSLNVLVRLVSLPSKNHLYPRSSPPRIWAVAEADPVRVEDRRDGVAVSAIGIEEQLALAGLLEALLVNDGDRHLRPVARVDHQPLGRILRRVVARRDFLHLPHLELAALGMIIVGRHGRDHRRI